MRHPLWSPTESSATREEVDEFIGSAFKAFERAFAEGGEEDRVTALGRTFALRYVGTGLRERFEPAIRHIASSGGHPELTICCWDATGSKIALPNPPWRPWDFVRGGRIRGMITGDLIAKFDGRAGLFEVIDARHRRGLFHVVDGSRLPAWHDRCPFRFSFAHWADAAGVAMMHAAAVVVDGSGLVLAGVSGSGKSTTASVAALNGMELLGDDTCLVDPLGPIVASIYGLTKLENESVMRIGADRLAAWAPIRSADSEAILAPSDLARQAPLRCVLALEINGEETTRLSERLDTDEALHVLMETVREENHGLTPGAIAALESVVAAAPVRRLLLGADQEEIVSALNQAAR